MNAKLTAIGFALSAVFGLGCNGEEVLEAKDDSVALAMDESTVIDVLANDNGVAPDAVIEIVDEPLAGVAQIVDGKINYDPETEYIGPEDIKYRVTNPDGESSEARIGIDIDCPECLRGRNIRLRWLAPETNVDGSPATISGYRVYSGPTDEPTELTMKSDLSEETVGFDFTQPEIAYDAWMDLRMVMGDTVCFRLTAYNQAGESDFSNSVCKTVDEEAATKADIPLDF